LFELEIEKRVNRNRKGKPSPTPKSNPAQLPFPSFTAGPVTPRPTSLPPGPARSLPPSHPARGPFTALARHRPNPLPGQSSRGVLASARSRAPLPPTRGPRLPDPLTARTRWQLRLPHSRNAWPRSPAANIGEVPIPGTHAQVTRRPTNSTPRPPPRDLPRHAPSRKP
jgi:hypothetical protein